MKSDGKFFIVLVTAPDLKTARKLSKTILQKRLAACANLIPKIETHYWWKNRIESSSEVLMVLKTTGASLAKLEKFVIAEHPYDTSEFVVLSFTRGNKKYLDWLAKNCSGGL